MYTNRKKDTSYGYFGKWYPYQDGGEMVPQNDPQAEAQSFLDAFSQLSPEAQQIVHQAIMQQTQG